MSGPYLLIPVLCASKHILAAGLGGQQELNHKGQQELNDISFLCVGSVFRRDCRDICRGTLHFTVETVGTHFFERC